VDNVSRFDRRLFPYSYFPQVPQVTEICFGRQGKEWMKIDWLCKCATTVWKILVNTRGAVDRPNGIVLKVYSRLFLVPKKYGKMRPVIDLSVLNQHLIVPHFKMEINRSIRGSILLGMWTTSLRQFLRFV
jgi:hypothetical protein